MSTDIPLNNSLSSSVYGTVLASTSSVPARGVVAPTPLLGVGGLPMATPHFHSLVLETLRHSSSGWQQGPNIPRHWYDGGAGWVTKYFYDSVPRDKATQEPGKFRCQALLDDGRRCDHEVSEQDWYKGTCCWSSGTQAHIRMKEHLSEAHGAVPPPRRQWSSDLFAFDGWAEAYACGPCQTSRQMMALAGWEDTLSGCWCFLFSAYGLALLMFPIYAAAWTRSRMLVLNNIDEGVCTTLSILFCCPVCSLAQTHRELSASGVWPGTSCGGKYARPSNYASLTGLECRAGKMAMV